MAKNTRSRLWAFVLYPEDKDTSDLIKYLESDNVEGIRGLYILHKGEPLKNDNGEPLTDEDGKPRIAKDHYHIMIEYPNARTAKGVQKSLCFDLRELEAVENEDAEQDEQEHRARHVEPVSDRVAMYVYFLHWSYRCSKQGKQRYSESDIQLLGNESCDFLLSCSYEKERTSRVMCSELLSKNTTTPKKLLHDCLDDERLIKFIMKNPYFVTKFIVEGDKK